MNEERLLQCHQQNLQLVFIEIDIVHGSSTLLNQHFQFTPIPNLLLSYAKYAVFVKQYLGSSVRIEWLIKIQNNESR